MVIGLLTIAAIPTTIAVAEGISEQKKKNSKDDDESRMAKFYLDVFCEANSRKTQEIHGKRCVVRDDKVSCGLLVCSVQDRWIEDWMVTFYLESQVYLDDPIPSKRKKLSHTVQAFYVEYPDEEREKTRGLVTTISVDPPMLNWIYVDKNTFELKYGNRTQSREHHVGPWDWTEDEAGLTIEDWEGFVAVEEGPGEWAVYYDRKDNRLRGIVPDKRVIQISLERKLLDDKGKD